jgi:hypothetical protein
MYTTYVIPTLLVVALLFTIPACAGSEALQITTTPGPTVTPALTDTPTPQPASMKGPACPDTFHQQERRQIEDDLEVRANQAFTLTFGSTPSVPCGWRSPEISHPTVVRQVDHQSTWPAAGATPKPGAPGAEIWVFQTRQAGSSALSWACICLDDQGAEEEVTGTFVVDVTVRAAVTPTPAPRITLITPNGGETWVEGETYRLQWRSSGVKQVNIAAAAGGKDLGHIATEVKADAGAYTWTIPKGFVSDFEPSGSDAMRIRVYAADNAEVYDENDAPFTISAE